MPCVCTSAMESVRLIAHRCATLACAVREIAHSCAKVICAVRLEVDTVRFATYTVRNVCSLSKFKIVYISNVKVILCLFQRETQTTPKNIQSILHRRAAQSFRVGRRGRRWLSRLHFWSFEPDFELAGYLWTPERTYRSAVKWTAEARTRGSRRSEVKVRRSRGSHRADKRFAVIGGHGLRGKKSSQRSAVEARRVAERASSAFEQTAAVQCGIAEAQSGIAEAQCEIAETQCVIAETQTGGSQRP